jgi:replicative DNA helicase
MIAQNDFRGDDQADARSGTEASTTSKAMPQAPATSNLVSLGTVLDAIRDDLYHGPPPVEFAISDKPWGSLALRPGDVLGIAAAPGIGKTAMVGQMTIDALRLQAEARCLMVNVEMAPKVLLERQLSRLSGVPLTEIVGRRNLLGRQHLIEPALATLAAIGERMFFLGPRFSLQRINEAVAEVQPQILVIDYLQRIECCDGVADGRMRLNTLMHEMRALASAGIAVVLVSAVSRTTSKKDGGYNAKELGMGSFRESSEIEYGCDDAVVIVEEQGERTDGRKVLNLRHVKSRNHLQQDLRLEFDGVLQRFRLLPDKKEDDIGGATCCPISPPSVPPKAKKSGKVVGVDPWSLDFPGDDSEPGE